MFVDDCMKEIKAVITEIETKVGRLKNNLQDSYAQNETLKENVSVLTSRLSERKKEAEDFQMKIDTLTQQLSNQTPQASSEKEDVRAEIDALIKEIDSCISRLKIKK